MADNDVLALLRRAVELAMPDIRKWIKAPRKGIITAVYPCNGKLYADVQLCRNDESKDETCPVLPKVEIVTPWAVAKGGMAPNPEIGVKCVVSWYDGDPAYPYISAFRSSGQLPQCEPGTLAMQAAPGKNLTLDVQGLGSQGGMSVDGSVAVTGNVGCEQVNDRSGNTNHHEH